MAIRCRTTGISSLVLAAAAAMALCASAPRDAEETASAAFGAGNYATAAGVYARAASARPDDVGLRVSAGVSLLLAKDYLGASRQLAEAVRIAPDAAVILQLKQTADREAEARGLKMARPIIVGTRATPGSPAPTKDTSIPRLLGAANALPDSAPLASLLGDAYQLAGDLGNAQTWYRKAAGLAPKWTKPRLGLAMALLDSDPPTAANLLEGVLKEEPGNAQAALWLGDAYTRMGRSEDAMSFYRRAESVPQTKADAKVRIGNELMKGQQVPQALQVFNEAQEVDPGNVGALAGAAQTNAILSNQADAIQTAEKTKDATQQASAQTQSKVLNVTGTVQSMAGNYQPAIDDLNFAVKLDPTNQDAYAQLARTFRNNGTLAGQNVYFAEKLQSSPRDVQALRYLVEGYEQSGDLGRQIAVLEQLASVDPAGGWTWRMRQGEAYWKQGARDKAFSAWLASVDLGYPNRTTRIAEAISRHEGAQGFVADRLGGRAGKTALHLRFAIENMRGNREQALALLDRVISMDPGNASLYGQKGFLLRAMGRDEDAQKALSHQRDLIPTPPTPARGK